MKILKKIYKKDSFFKKNVIQVTIFIYLKEHLNDFT